MKKPIFIVIDFVNAFPSDSFPLFPLHPSFHSRHFHPSTTSSTFLPQPLNRCRRRRLTDVDDVDLEVVEGGKWRKWKKGNGGCGRAVSSSKTQPTSLQHGHDGSCHSSPRFPTPQMSYRDPQARRWGHSRNRHRHASRR